MGVPPLSGFDLRIMNLLHVCLVVRLSANCSKIFLDICVTDATLVTILGMSVYSTYAYLPAYIHNVLVYFGYINDT